MIILRLCICPTERDWFKADCIIKAAAYLRAERLIFYLFIYIYIYIYIYCWPYISIYLFSNINQLDALNFIISLFHASTCFEYRVLIVRRAKLYYTVSGIITPVGGRPVHRLREAWNKIIIKFSASSWLILINKLFFTVNEKLFWPYKA